MCIRDRESRDRKAARLDRLLELAGAARLEQLEFLLQAGDGGTDVDPEWEFAGLPDTEARERREAGEWGERFVRDYLVRRFQDKGARLVEQEMCIRDSSDPRFRRELQEINPQERVSHTLVCPMADIWAEYGQKAIGRIYCCLLYTSWWGDPAAESPPPGG